MPIVYALDGLVPVVDPTAYVHPTAVLIGDVIVGPQCYIGPGAALRGDFGRLIIGAGSNIQDCCVVHTHPDWDTIVEENGHVGHCSILHCCILRKNVLIGMNAVVMDGAEVGESAMIGAMAFVKVGAKIPPRTLATGIPAKVVRDLTQDELEGKMGNTGDYQKLARRSLATSRPVEALTAIEANRGRYSSNPADPLFSMRTKKTPQY
ncbi:MAG: phenylacetic acid degradation protein PaaY [Rhodospirillales bacterium]|nr:phenylacetic acid degradation protein PaaY [Rhodospirillales bacterium]